MGDYILFSAVGGHDPIANYHDGAILHICRQYRPKQVYLFLSKEMVERSDRDNRYVDSLERLQKHLNYKIDRIELIRKDDLTEVQLFDTFYQEFEPIILHILEENPESTVLLNLSSGTPAMKSAMEIITAISSKNIVAVQVATPEKKENPKAENPLNYDLDLFWEMNEDNNAIYENRCRAIHSQNLEAKIKVESIKKLICSYDYHAAFLLAQEIEPYLDPMALHMLAAASMRAQLDLKGYSKIANKENFDFLPVKEGQILPVVEYVLILQVKRSQGNYADFIRALSPIILDVFDLYLQQKCGIRFKDDCCKYIDQRKSYYPYAKKMNASERGKQVLWCLTKKWPDIARLESSFYSSAQLFVLINEFSKDDYVKDCAKKLREKVEVELRNQAAHEIVSVTESVIVKTTGMTSRQILDCLKGIIIRSGYNVKQETWDSYDAMNRKILQMLD